MVKVRNRRQTRKYPGALMRAGLKGDLAFAEQMLNRVRRFIGETAHQARSSRLLTLPPSLKEAGSRFPRNKFDRPDWSPELSSSNGSDLR
jgi:hypothetical protein